MNPQTKAPFAQQDWRKPLNLERASAVGFERRPVAESRTETAPVNSNGGVVIGESVADALRSNNFTSATTAFIEHGNLLR
jgi:hypothetical protein